LKQGLRVSVSKRLYRRIARELLCGETVSGDTNHIQSQHCLEMGSCRYSWGSMPRTIRAALAVLLLGGIELTRPIHDAGGGGPISL